MVLMTAPGTPEMNADAYRLGVLGVLDKPSDVDEILQVLTAAGSPLQGIKHLRVQALNSQRKDFRDDD